jgi:hypothetical protein
VLLATHPRTDVLELQPWESRIYAL